MKAILFTPDRHHFLVQKRHKPGDRYHGFWEFPGGRIHAGESVHQCLAREIREETGIELQRVLGDDGARVVDRFGGVARVLSPLLTVEVEAPGPIFGHYYGCLARSSAVRETTEGSCHRWMTVEEFRHAFLDPPVPEEELSTIDLLAMRVILKERRLPSLVS